MSVGGTAATCRPHRRFTRPKAHSAGAAAAAGRSWVSTERPRWTTAAMMAPTIGAKPYNQASLRLPVTIIGPSARAGLKAAPVNAPPMRMLKTKVRPIATGARWAARPATAVLSTTVTRKKASTASTMKPIAGVIVTGAPPRTRPCASSGVPRPATQHDPQQQRCGDSAGDLADDVAGRLGGGDGADSEDADGHGRVHMPSRYTAIGADEDHQGEAVGEGNRGDTTAGSSADDGGSTGADEHQRQGADELRKELGCR